jgi:hypothetical protein
MLTTSTCPGYHLLRLLSPVVSQPWRASPGGRVRSTCLSTSNLARQHARVVRRMRRVFVNVKIDDLFPCADPGTLCKHLGWTASRSGSSSRVTTGSKAVYRLAGP